MEGLLAGKGRRILICPYDGLSLLQITWTRSSARHAARERHANLLRFAPSTEDRFQFERELLESIANPVESFSIRAS